MESDKDFDVIYEPDEAFRNSIGTINAEGNRQFLFPKKPAGKWTNYRQYVSYLFLAIFFTLPFVKIAGQPFLMLNVPERKFVIFGQIFWPEDFFLFVLAMIIGVIFVAVFTVAYGRLFCGWICPQTIFLEHVFRRIEYWIDGDRGQQLRLTKSPWNAEKIRKRVLKNTIFFAISFIISNFFLMYIISYEAWWQIVSDNPAEHLTGLGSILIFSGVFFFVFAWFREQACLIVCPYGRLQGALLDRNSVVIAYDYKRGETRGKFRKKEDRSALGKGDCIDCNACVDVCPTGIDIRNGTQLECINCTACIDACNSIMTKINKPEGLIRYDSENNIASGKKKIFTPRVIAYTGVLVVLMSIFMSLLFTRSEVETIFLRMPGQRYQKVDETHYTNVYNYKLINKTANDNTYHFELLSPEGKLQTAGGEIIDIKGSELAEGAVIITLEKEVMNGKKTELEIGVFQGERQVETLTTNFNGPLKR